MTRRPGYVGRSARRDAGIGATGRVQCRRHWMRTRVRLPSRPPLSWAQMCRRPGKGGAPCHHLRSTGHAACAAGVMVVATSGGPVCAEAKPPVRSLIVQGALGRDSSCVRPTAVVTHWNYTQRRRCASANEARAHCMAQPTGATEHHAPVVISALAPQYYDVHHPAHRSHDALQRSPSK